MSSLVPPHGGRLVNRLLPQPEAADRLEAARHLTTIRISSRAVSDLLMIGTGAFSPLDGFMGREEYNAVLSDMHLTSGELWPIPIVLDVSSDLASRLKEGTQVALASNESGNVVATMEVREQFAYSKTKEAKRVFGTDDPHHPGVQKLLQQGDIYIAGPVEVLQEDGYPERFPEYARPVETRAEFGERGWRTVAAFQTRNPIHRSHEFLTKVALELVDGLLIHPVVGKLKDGDIPAEVRMECYRALLERYYPANRVLLRVYPMEMRYAGPKEALLHAIIRQNFGCTHICIGRDHAGVGRYYGPFDAHAIFDRIAPGELAIQPLRFDNTFWCYSCGSMASHRTCPHDHANRLNISGTELRAMLADGKLPPNEFTRPEVAQILMRFYASR